MTPSHASDAPRSWPLWVLLPLAVLGPPILGIALVGFLPHSLSQNGSVGGLVLFPFVAVAFILFGAARAPAGWRTRLFVGVAAAVTLLCLPILFFGLMAP